MITFLHSYHPFFSKKREPVQNAQVVTIFESVVLKPIPRYHWKTAVTSSSVSCEHPPLSLSCWRSRFLSLNYFITFCTLSSVDPQVFLPQVQARSDMWGHIWGSLFRCNTSFTRLRLNSSSLLFGGTSHKTLWFSFVNINLLNH